MKSLTSRTCLISVFLAATALNLNGSPALRPETMNAVKEYCYDCHDREMQKGSLNLEGLAGEQMEGNTAAWEKVVRKLSGRQMPPIGKPRPDEKTYKTMVSDLA